MLLFPWKVLPDILTCLCSSLWHAQTPAPGCAEPFCSPYCRVLFSCQSAGRGKARERGGMSARKRAGDGSVRASMFVISIHGEERPRRSVWRYTVSRSKTQRALWTSASAPLSHGQFSTEINRNVAYTFNSDEIWPDCTVKFTSAIIIKNVKICCVTKKMKLLQWTSFHRG